MKKKASLLISGVTTVAMLAVAVGSFAAWDTLTAKEGNFTAKTGSPATLAVTATDLKPTDTPLVPSDAIQGENDKAAVNVGELTATLKTTTDEDKSKGAVIKCNLNSLTLASTEKADDFTVTLVPEASASGVSDVVLTKGTPQEIKANVKYTAKLELTKSIDTTAAADYTAKDIAVNLEVTADKVSSTPAS